MTTASHRGLSKVRVLSGIGFILGLVVALGIRLGIDDGGWPLFVPPTAAAIAFARPTRGTLLLAIAATAGILVLGLMTFGILYGFSLAALILALTAAPDHR